MGVSLPGMSGPIETDLQVRWRARITNTVSRSDVGEYDSDTIISGSVDPDSC